MKSQLFWLVFSTVTSSAMTTKKRHQLFLCQESTVISHSLKLEPLGAILEGHDY